MSSRYGQYDNVLQQQRTRSEPSQTTPARILIDLVQFKHCNSYLHGLLGARNYTFPSFGPWTLVPYPTQLDALMSTVNLAYILYTMILLDRSQMKLQDGFGTYDLYDVSPYRCPEFDGRMD